MTQETQIKTPNKYSWIGKIAVFAVIGTLCFALAYYVRQSVVSQEPAAPAAASLPEAKPVAAAPAPAPVKDPDQIKVEASEALIAKADSSYANLTGYEAVFDTRELNDKGEWVTEASFLRFCKPFTIYMGWKTGDKKGMQIMYSQNNFEDKMIVKLPGLLLGLVPPVSVALDDPRLLKQSKHPITKAGIGYFLSDFGETFRKLQAEGRIKVLSVGEPADVNGEKGTLLDVIFLDPSEEYARRAVVFSDENHLPIEISLYKTENDLVESYRYAGLQVNPSKDDPEFKKAADPSMVEKFQSVQPA